MDQFERCSSAMDQAGRELGDGNPDNAVDLVGCALDAMRKGAQSPELILQRCSGGCPRPG